MVKINAINSGDTYLPLEHQEFSTKADLHQEEKETQTAVAAEYMAEESTLPKPIELRKIDNFRLESEVDFEQVGQELAKLLLIVANQRRNHYHKQNEVYDNEYKAQVEENAASYRSFKQLAAFAGETALRATTVLVRVAPQLLPQLEQLFGTNYLITRFPNDKGELDIQKMASEIATVLTTGEQIVGSAKSVFVDSSDRATQIKAQALADYLRSLADQKRNEQMRYVAEESELMRSLEQIRNKENDFKIGMARGG